MKATIIEGGDLLLTVDDQERGEIQAIHDEDPAAFGSDLVMADVFEDLVCNSEYDWILPEQVGALTSAPMLATFRDDGQGDAAPDPGDSARPPRIRMTISGGLDLTTDYEQVFACYAENSDPDRLLLIRVQDFYEVLGSDAA